MQLGSFLNRVDELTENVDQLERKEKGISKLDKIKKIYSQREMLADAGGCLGKSADQ